MTPDSTTDLQKASFPIVAIGAAAGGVSAVTELLQHLSNGTGMAYVYIQYPDSTTDGNLVPALSMATEMPVLEAKEDVEAAPDHVYVLPVDEPLNLVNRIFKREKQHRSYLRKCPSTGGLQSWPSSIRNR
jgi:two-component system CheB/CheR fusion protein